MRGMKTLIFSGLAGMCLVFTGCASTTVQRVDVDTTIDLSGRWNDADARMIAQRMIDDCLSRGWQPMFMGQKNRPPVVIVGEIVNQSHEHINTEIFTKSLERALINSGKVKFVADKEQRLQVREEREDQQKGNTSVETMKQKGKEVGADFILIGSVNSIKDETQGKYVIMYQVNLELVDLESNEKTWLGEESIKKVVEKSKYSL